MGHEFFVQGDSEVRLGRAGEAGAAAGGVGVEGELGDHQKAPAHLFQVQVHPLLLVLEDPEVADLVRQLHGGVLCVVGPHAQQDQVALADLAADLVFNGDGRVLHAGDDSAHGNSLLIVSQRAG